MFPIFEPVMVMFQPIVTDWRRSLPPRSARMVAVVGALIGAHAAAPRAVARACARLPEAA